MSEDTRLTVQAMPFGARLAVLDELIDATAREADRLRAAANDARAVAGELQGLRDQLRQQLGEQLAAEGGRS